MGVAKVLAERRLAIVLSLFHLADDQSAQPKLVQFGAEDEVRIEGRTLRKIVRHQRDPRKVRPDLRAELQLATRHALRQSERFGFELRGQTRDRHAALHRAAPIRALFHFKERNAGRLVAALPILVPLGPAVVVVQVTIPTRRIEVERAVRRDAQAFDY